MTEMAEFFWCTGKVNRKEIQSSCTLVQYWNEASNGEKHLENEPLYVFSPSYDCNYVPVKFQPVDFKRLAERYNH